MTQASQATNVYGDRPFRIGNQACFISLHYEAPSAYQEVVLRAEENGKPVNMIVAGREQAVCGAVDLIRWVRTELYRRGMHLDASYAFTELDFIASVSLAVVKLKESTA